MEIISKDKPKGLAYAKHKKMKKAKRLVEEKKFKRLTENKRKNAENRKERAIEKSEQEKIKKVVIKDYNKGMFLILVEEKEEKRALLFDKKTFNKNNIKDLIDEFQIKLYGQNCKISKLLGYNDIKDILIWKISEEL